MAGNGHSPQMRDFVMSFEEADIWKSALQSDLRKITNREDTRKGGQLMSDSEHYSRMGRGDCALAKSGSGTAFGP